ncbi:hypothetical protein [Nocardia sp. NPDC005998]|uniref:hypothetical protein n=1 Tax=Nocardia sp. NPDC005998 TaxID=3156894 RepID=UPI0033B0E84B
MRDLLPAQSRDSTARIGGNANRLRIHPGSPRAQEVGEIVHPSSIATGSRAEGGPAGREPHYTDRGINGPIDDLLFPIQHGILYYPGMDVLPPFVTYGADRVSPADFTDVAKAWEQRLLSIEQTDPIAFRTQNGGDYELPALRLREGLEAKGRTGFGLHVRA